MLKKIYHWILYGELFFWRQFLSLLGILFIFSSVMILRSDLEYYSNLKLEGDKAQAELSAQLSSMNKQVFNLTEIEQEPWSELGKRYDLAISTEQDRVYFLGKTEKILNLLDYVFLQAYPIQGFSLTPYEHKILLAIEL